MVESNTNAGEHSSLFWIAYGQISAMLAAFSLLVFLTHFADVGLRGLVKEAFEWWVQYVRPVAGAPLEFLTTLLPADWRFPIPASVKDYFAVGFVFVLSFWRAVRPRLSDFPGGLKELAAIFFLWTIMLPLFVFLVIEDKERRTMAVATLAPLAYLGFLFAANAWLR